MPDDILYMRRALQLAGKGRGLVSPNPMVGCVIVKAGNVIAEGWHKACGQDHAEVDALKQAGAKASGATVYITLEPCAHWGRTPPCVDALIEAGVRRVVIAMTDPNPLTNGKSVEKLNEAGIKTTVGVCQDDARAMNAAFIKHMTLKMPFVVAKTAQTLDGKIGGRTGDSRWITSVEARAFARNRRNEFDAILVGKNTVLADDPGLDAPGKDIKKIVLDSRLVISERAKLFGGTESGQVILATTVKAPQAKIRRLLKRGVSVIVCPEKDGRIDLKALFKELAKKEISSILIEGGAAVIGSALKAGLVDELNVYIAPKILGDEKARSSVVGLDILKVTQAKVFRVSAVERLGMDLFLTLKV
ncbi:MAG: bifunctional diaminohydroxyphosphoribosylaminopyrimidine deaminase/5-amino-6-(5-phosphoribosylamino)uracil reductase RibD [Candidatus Omnitrophica bacterium]|nr:bifunctional diaminohydroxyphosphoribosylaminopyrimidine deaminase/5-amino-6-(5-phosphoribosylamino)uracil reductase RibD [Candidatus Omnitrophota bacterium]